MTSGKVDLYVGNTDKDWFDHLKAQPSLQEVNHWQPSGVKFKILREGGIFFFRLKSPINMIGGFGLLASTENASISLLWDSIGTGNGVSSKEEFVSRVKHYRTKNSVKGIVDEKTQVGFKILTEPVFLDEKDWFPEPSDWSPQIVVGKSYSSDSSSGQDLLSHYMNLAGRSSGRDSIARRMFGFEEEVQAGYKTRSVKQRTGQHLFKINLMYAYGGKCAMTGCNIEEVLEAAHIVPFSKSHDHSIANGILLRKDIHTLFDKGLIAIDKNYRIRLSEEFKSNYPQKDNIYFKLDGQKIQLPHDRVHWPRIPDNLVE